MEQCKHTFEVALGQPPQSSVTCMVSLLGGGGGGGSRGYQLTNIGQAISEFVSCAFSMSASVYNRSGFKQDHWGISNHDTVLVYS